MNPYATQNVQTAEPTKPRRSNTAARTLVSRPRLMMAWGRLRKYVEKVSSSEQQKLDLMREAGAMLAAGASMVAIEKHLAVLGLEVEITIEKAA